jgi:DNA polymerase III delta subunit
VYLDGYYSDSNSRFVDIQASDGTSLLQLRAAAVDKVDLYVRIAGSLTYIGSYDCQHGVWKKIDVHLKIDGAAGAYELQVDNASAVAAIISWLGQDQARLPSLIDVLSSTYGTSKKLSLGDVEPFLGDQGSVLPWDLTDAIDKGDSPIALAMLRRMVRSGEYHPLQIMSLLHGHYTKLMKLDGPDIRNTQDAMSIIGSKSDFQAKKYVSTYQRLGTRNVGAAVQLLARADIDLRGGKDLEEELILEILIARLSRLGGVAQRVTSRR